MKSLIFFLSVLCSSLVCAQVDVSTSLPAKTFLKYEGIPLRMEITNRSDVVLRMGVDETEDQLLIRVRDLDNRVMPRTEAPLLSTPWFIQPGETSVRTFDLVQLFRITQAMSYRCLQDVSLAGDSYTGTPLMFDVVNGQVFDEIKRRKSDRIFTMIGINRKGGDEVMMRVMDYKETMVLATYYLERHLRFYPPFMKVDKQGQIATLHYITPNQVVMCQFAESGKPIGRTYFSATPGVPIRLLEHPEKGFLVQGGVKIEGHANSVEESTE
jgi:hypothetical protein